MFFINDLIYLIILLKLEVRSVYKLVVFGNLPIATRIVEYIESVNEFELSAIVIGDRNPHNCDPWIETPTLYEYCKQKGLLFYDMKEFGKAFKNQRFDLGLSCRFNKLISSEIITLFKNGIINMHGGLLPEFRGLYSCNHTILSESKIGGGTLHYIDDGIDTGDIIRRCEFVLDENDTGYSVFQKTQLALEKNMKEIIPLAVKGKINIDQEQFKGIISNYYDKHSLENLKQVDFYTMNSETISRIIRAFDFPGHEPAYFLDDHERKVYLRYTY